jgi:hypothetical protein
MAASTLEYALSIIWAYAVVSIAFGRVVFFFFCTPFSDPPGEKPAALWATENGRNQSDHRRL